LIVVDPQRIDLEIGDALRNGKTRIVRLDQFVSDGFRIEVDELNVHALLSGLVGREKPVMPVDGVIVEGTVRRGTRATQIGSSAY